MSKRYSGALITKTPVTPTSLSAPGVWSLSDQAAAQATNTWPFPRDPQFKNVTMLLHGDGSAGPVAATGVGAGVSTTITNFNADASTNNFNVTINGDTKSNNFNPYQAGYYSNSLNGSSNFTAGTTASNFLCTGSATGITATFEAWVFPTAYSTGGSSYLYSGIHTKGTTYFNFGIRDGAVRFYWYDGAQKYVDSASTSDVPLNTWTHVAVTISGATIKIYINGALSTTSATYTGVQSAGSGNTEYIGKENNGYYVNGYVSNYRLTNTVVYSAAFTPSTTPLTAVTGTQLLTCQSNRFIDNSSNAFTVTPVSSPQVSPAIPFTLPTTVATYGSGYFDGTGDYLSLANVAALQPGTSTNPFCVECWVYPTSSGADLAILGNYTVVSYPTNTNGFDIIKNSSNQVTFRWGYPNYADAGNSTAMSLNTWNHIAVCRNSSGSMSCYLNGTRWFNTSSNTSITTATASSFWVGWAGSLSGTTINPLAGYITDARLVKGSAVYDPTVSTLTVPTAPLTAITNTSLLTTQYNGGGNNSGFKDSSQFDIPITRNGNIPQGTFTPYGSNWSNYLGGAGNYFQTPASSATTIVGTLSSTVNLTIECWIFPTAYNSSANFPGLIGDMVATTENNNWSWGITNTGTLMLYWNTGTQYRATSASAVSLNTWTHIALNVSAGAITMYINGVSQTLSGTTTLSTPASSNGYLVIGQWNNGSGGTGGVSNGLYTGYISNLRVVKASTYTSSFTPSIVPLTAITSTSLLYCQSNRFVDNSSNALAISIGGSPSVQRYSPFAPLTVYNPTTYGGSGYFDGSGDYLTAPSTSGQLGSGNFTIECWSYLISRVALFPTIWGNYTSFTTGSLAIFAGHNSADTTKYNIAIDGTFPAIQSTASIVYNQWTHIALVRNSTTITLYINGVANGTATSSATLNGTSGTTYIGTAGDNISNGYLNGYLTDSRVLVGTALYTTAFTPPTAPLTAITNTRLLLNYTNPAILDNAMLNNLETVGNAAVSTSVKKYGAASMVFDGTGDALYSTSQATTFGTGDFTLEFWVYFNAVNNGVVKYIYDMRNSGATSASFLAQESSNAWTFWNGAGSTLSTGFTGSTFSATTWTHVAICRSSGTTKFFVNGTQTGSVADTSSYANSTLTVGTRYSYSDGLNGYIDDLRITKAARYTATFTVPDQAFPNG